MAVQFKRRKRNYGTRGRIVFVFYSVAQSELKNEMFWQRSCNDDHIRENNMRRSQFDVSAHGRDDDLVGCVQKVSAFYQAATPAAIRWGSPRIDEPFTDSFFASLRFLYRAINSSETVTPVALAQDPHSQQP